MPWPGREGSLGSDENAGLQSSKSMLTAKNTLGCAAMKMTACESPMGSPCSNVRLRQPLAIQPAAD